MKWALLAVLCAFGVAPVRAQEVVVCDDIHEPETLDPQKSFSEKSLTIVRQIYEGLVSLDPDGKVQPALAVSWKWVDDKTLEFNLRKDVVFHNGEPFDSKAVRFSIERYLNPATHFPALPFISTIASVEPMGPWKVRIKTARPDGLLMNRLAGFIVMIPPRYVQEKGEEALATNPVGTGPFMFQGWSRQQEIVLAANPKYWRRGVPKISRLRFRFLPTEEQIPALFKGDVHIVTEIPGTATLKITENSRTKIQKRETLYTVIGHFNTSRAPLSDIRVRKAINLAVDRAELIRYDLLGNGSIVAGASVSGEIGHDPALKAYEYKPEEAKKLLREAGVTMPLHLKTLVVHSERTARIIAKQLESVGIILDLHVVPDSQAVSTVGNEEWDFGIAGFPDPLAHVDFPLSLLFFSASPYSLHHDPEFDRLLAQAESTLDSKESERRFQALDRRVYDQVLGLFLYQRIKTYGLQKSVIFSPSVTGMPIFDSVEITGSGKGASR